MVSKPRVITGAQTAQRTLQILKLLSLRNTDGLSTSDIVAITGAERSAVQRALSTLVEEGFATKGLGTGRFHLGVGAMQLGFATFDHSPLKDKYAFGMQRIARLTGHSVFLSMRLGDYLICIHREEGSTAIRVPRTRPGDVKVLGTTAGGLALLSRRSDDEIGQLYRKHEPAFAQARMNSTTLRRNILSARRLGYGALSDNVSEGVTAIGVCLASCGASDAVAAIGGATSQITVDRLPMLQSLLLSLDDEHRESVNKSAVHARSAAMRPLRPGA